MDVVASTKLIGKALPLGVNEDTTDSTKRFRGEELHLRIRIIWLHQPGRVDLDPLEVDGGSADRFAHLDPIASAVLAVRRRQVQKIGAVLCEETAGCEIGAEATTRENHGSVLLHDLPAKLVLTTDASAGGVRDELVDACLADNLGLRVVGVLRDLS